MIDLREELNGRPGFIAAVEAMIKGLHKQDKRGDFYVDMNSYGGAGGKKSSVRKLVCYGCAATCAIQEFSGINLNTYNISNRSLRAAAANLTLDSVAQFEYSIDALRIGSVNALSDFCQLDMNDIKHARQIFWVLPALSDRYWKRRLPKYEAALYKIKRDWA